jgi:hypothetical protein
VLTSYAKKLPQEMQEDLLREREEASKLFQAHLERLMEERGIESLEELYERFVETGYAHVPVPGLHEGKPVSLELFKRLAARKTLYIYGELTWGLAEVFELSHQDLDELILLYLFVEKREA